MRGTQPVSMTIGKPRKHFSTPHPSPIYREFWRIGRISARGSRGYQPRSAEEVDKIG